MSNSSPLTARRRRIVGLIAALVGLAAVAPLVPILCLVAQEPRKQVKIASPLHLVPSDAAFFMHIRIAELTQSDVLRLLPPETRKEMLRELCFGIAAEQVDTVTIATFHAPLMSVLDPRVEADILLRRRHTMGPGDFKDFKDFKDVPKDFFKEKGFDFKDKKDGFKDAAKEKALLRRPLEGVPVAFQKEDLPHADKDFGFQPRYVRPQDGPDRGVIILTMRDDLDVEDLILMRPERAFKSKKGRTLLEMHGLVFHRLDRRTLVCTEWEAGLDRFLDRPVPATIQGPLAPALERAASGKHTVTMGQAVPEKALSAAEEAGQADPMFRYGGGPSRGVARTVLPLFAARPGILTLNLNKELGAAAEFHFADEAAAKKAVGAVEDVAVLVRIFGIGELESAILFRGMPLDEAEMERYVLEKLLLSEMEGALRTARAEQKGSTVRIAAALPSGLDKLQERARVAAKEQLADPKFLGARQRNVSANNLKNIVIGMHNFHDTYKIFPPQALCDRAGKPLLSWRVAILPFVDDTPLYNEFRLNEAWDSPHNIKLLEKMPKIYAPPGIKTREPYTTYYQGFVGPSAALERRLSPKHAWGALGLRMADFTDGTSNTLLVAEAAEAVPWTKPADMPFQPKGALPKLGGQFAPGFHAAFADGTVRYFARPPADDVLRALITRNGGEVVDLDQGK
jgi:hypothetical protein